jgi:hypothetical protein
MSISNSFHHPPPYSAICHVILPSVTGLQGQFLHSIKVASSTYHFQSASPPHSTICHKSSVPISSFCQGSMWISFESVSIYHKIIWIIWQFIKADISSNFLIAHQMALVVSNSRGHGGRRNVQVYFSLEWLICSSQICTYLFNMRPGEDSSAT